MLRKKMEKRGISPLIATVIIIGFTIVLAAMVIQFGTGFLKKTTEGAEKSSTIKQVCTIGLSNLKVSAKLVKSGTAPSEVKSYEVRLQNDNNEVTIYGFILRMYDENGDIKLVKTASGKDLAELEIGPFGVEKLVITTVAAPPATPDLESFTPNEVGILPHVKAKATDVEKATCDNEVKTGIVGA